MIGLVNEQFNAFATGENLLDVVDHDVLDLKGCVRIGQFGWR